MPPRLPYLCEELDRYENVRLYARKRGAPKKIRLRSPFGSPEFLLEYGAAVRVLNGLEQAAEPLPTDRMKVTQVGTFRWLAETYMKSYGFTAMTIETQRARTSILEGCLVDRINPEEEALFGNIPLEFIERKHIKTLRDRKSSTPTMSTARLKALSVMFRWALEAEHIDKNPVTDVQRLNYHSDGHHTWTIAEVKKFYDFHKVGTKARLAIDLMLFTGIRKSDAAAMGPQHVVDGCLSFIPKKTARTTFEPAYLPILPCLQTILDASELGANAFVITSTGNPFSTKGFGNWFREQCDKVGLKHCTAHGLRKAGAVMASENGASDQQMMAVFNWSSTAMPAHYAKKASKKKLIANSMHLIVSLKKE